MLGDNLVNGHYNQGNILLLPLLWPVACPDAKGDGTVLGKFISDRLAHTSRLYTEKETMQLVFKACRSSSPSHRLAADSLRQYIPMVSLVMVVYWG